MKFLFQSRALNKAPSVKCNAPVSKTNLSIIVKFLRDMMLAFKADRIMKVAQYSLTY